MWMWIVGAILIVVGIILFAIRTSHAKKLAQVLAVQTSTCAEAAERCTSASQMGATWSGDQIEIKGVVEPRESLTAELSGRECACYRCEVVREWEEERTETDSEGKRRRRTHRGTDTVSKNEVLNPFLVRDDTGTILVDPQGAKIDWVKSVEKYERGDPEGGTLRLGGFSLNIGGLTLGGGRRTVGYRYKEWILPPQQAVYILGGPSAQAGEPCIGRPTAKGSKFLISVKSEEELIRGARTAILWLTVASVLTALGGIVLVAMGLAKK